MQVRLAFSIAIRPKSDILVLDEVLAVGDEAFQRKCEAYFARVKKSGKTIILVTHSMESVRKYCSRAIMLHEGRVVVHGSPNDVSNEYSIENLNAATYDKNEDKKESLIQDLDVKLLPEKLISQSSILKIKISYRVLAKIPTRIKVSAHDIDRNVPLFATDSPVVDKDQVYMTFCARFDSINDTNMKVSVSIRNENYEILHFLPDSLSPILSLKRTDYPDSTRKTTWALLFDRGEWKE
jgi:ABC-2 type transport system ATP-binding protein